MKFIISAWNAVSPFHSGKSDWCRWVKNGQTGISGMHEQEWTKTFLSAMQRRRLSPLSRQVFAAAWPLLPENEHCPVVFVSHDGEVNRSFQLWQDLLTNQTVSPTSFALSVHNAVVGQWSLLRHECNETVAIAARQHGLEIGVAEAYGLLMEGAEKVLVIVAEEPIKAEGVTASRAPFSFALALLITAGESDALDYVATAIDQTEEAYYNSSLQWITAQCNRIGCWQQPAAGGYWQWQIGYSNA